MPLPIRAFFDLSCPYCYLAWCFVKKLKESIPLADEWVTWEIHPDIPQEGLKIQDVVKGINLEERRKKLNALGEPIGFILGDNDMIPSTRLALETAEFARENHKMHEWIDAVYHANFVEGKNIGDTVVLFEIAKAIGLETDKLGKALDSGCYSHLLREHDQECVQKKIEWVPTIFSGEEKVIEGAFTFKAFEEVIRAHIL